jgi:hypothetical protein
MSPSNLVELIEKDLDFEKVLDNLKVLLSRINFWTYKMCVYIYIYIHRYIHTYIHIFRII